MPAASQAEQESAAAIKTDRTSRKMRIISRFPVERSKLGVTMPVQESVAEETVRAMTFPSLAAW